MELLGFLVALLAIAWWVRRPNTPKAKRSKRRYAVQAHSYGRRGTVMIDSNGPISRVATAPMRAKASDCWVPQGKTRTIQRRRITDGLIYVGTGLQSADCEWIAEPALIDPELEYREAPPSEPMGYWPTFSEISPSHRAAHLDWLASGRRDPTVELGHVFLFFYGLERRALCDSKTDRSALGELPAIRNETARILSIYGGSRSLRSYATDFLNALDALLDQQPTQDQGALGEPEDPPTAFSIQRAAALCARSKTPLPAPWALAWLHHDARFALRTPARRCRDEFDTLFRIRYAAKYGDGMILKPCKRTVSVSYRPASAGLPSVELPTDLPDILALSGPHRRIQELATTCCDDLSSYSRFVGKSPEQRASLNAFALMPADLVQHEGQALIGELSETLGAALGSARGGVFQTEDLLGRWIDGDLAGLGKRESVPLIQLLGHAGYGIEPDVRFGGPPLSRSSNVSLFRMGRSSHVSPSSAYSAAALLLQLAVTVSASDGDLSKEEEKHLQEHLAGSLHLDEPEELRLSAHLQWLLADPPRLTGLKKRVAALDTNQRHQAASLLVAVAWADGTIEPSEVKMLQRIYKLLELDPEKIHQDLHESRAGSPIDTGPVVVRRQTAPAQGYAIPPRPKKPAPPRAPPAKAPALDEAAIATKLHQTAAVSSLLATIFTEEEPASPVPAPAPGPEAATGGLSLLLQRIGARSQWSRDEYEALALEIGLLPDGALESLNDLAFEQCDDALWEGDDPIEINLDIHRELVS